MTNALLVGLAILGLVLLALYAWQPVRIQEEHAQPIQVRLAGWTVAQALHTAGLTLRPEDQVEPALDQPAWPGSLIQIRRAVVVHLWEAGQVRVLAGLERLPADLLARHGIPFSAADQLLLNGRPLPLDRPLPAGQPLLLQLERPRSVKIVQDDQPRTFTTHGASVSRALWDAGIRLSPGDRLSPPANQALPPAGAGPSQPEIVYRPAQDLTIHSSQQAIQARSAAGTVAEALTEAGLPLQGLDYSEPAANQPLPEDGQIRVVRVREEIVLNETLLPYERATQPDDSLPLDQRAVTQPGLYGVQVTRERVRYEDGQETSRVVDSEWVASQPATEIVGVGTRIVPMSMDTPSGPIEYYRAVQVYATSYSPCRIGTGACSWTTASGMRLTKGIVAVTRSWYRLFAGQRVYIPGYGIAVIADVGGGIPGRYWIDLGFDDDQYESQHFTGWTTVYFLTPAPANVPWSLP